MRAVYIRIDVRALAVRLSRARLRAFHDSTRSGPWRTFRPTWPPRRQRFSTSSCWVCRWEARMSSSVATVNTPSCTRPCAWVVQPRIQMTMSRSRDRLRLPNSQSIRTRRASYTEFTDGGALESAATSTPSSYGTRATRPWPLYYACPGSTSRYSISGAFIHVVGPLYSKYTEDGRYPSDASTSAVGFLLIGLLRRLRRAPLPSPHEIAGRLGTCIGTSFPGWNIVGKRSQSRACEQSSTFPRRTQPSSSDARRSHACSVEAGGPSPLYGRPRRRVLPARTLIVFHCGRAVRWASCARAGACWALADGRG
ncbi:hypothetical protein PYCCODRAFT_632784 [Trametes coccinea BRFM310]|uniref:Uncharacterized protein n=1 Tax=Trametes coccinea (strain BRFM310) TaxID=1353009 RepID=A0A1Y2J2R6_TRAC3|nr:hypothetical protein PYCCODRAFT_632784 [Trametes coccinea BRFM310]